MIRRILACTFFLLIASCASAATAVSPNVSGSWIGNARGTDYKSADPTDPNSMPSSKPAAGNATATLTQVGNDLTVSMSIVAQDFISLSLTGKAGDFGLWATGTHTNSDGSLEQVFMSGKYASKGDKIAGKMVFYHSKHITIVSCSFKKNVSTALTRANMTANLDASSAVSSRGDGAPFNIAGKANGKTSVFATSDKLVAYKVDVNGTVDPTANTAVITFNETSPITFNVSNVDADKQIVLAGPGGSENVIMFGKSGDTSAAGTGYIFGGTRLVEFKFAVKQP